MGPLVVAFISYLRAFFVPRHKLALEAAALRQQLAVFKRKQPRPRLGRLDRLFWTALRRMYIGWADALILVKPETVVSWHRSGFHLFVVAMAISANWPTESSSRNPRIDPSNE